MITGNSYFILKNGINGSGTFYTFRERHFNEVTFWNSKVEGDVSKLIVAIINRWEYSKNSSMKILAFEEFKTEYLDTPTAIFPEEGAELSICLGIIGKDGGFVLLTDNTHLNFPGMSSNHPSKIDYTDIMDFRILIEYRLNFNEPIFF